MESAVAKEKREESMKLEGSLESKRNTMKLGAQLKGGFEEMSSVALRNKMRTSPDEEERKACYEGLRSIGPFVCNNGFVEVVKARNAMAKALGYVDYYDYKVTQAEVGASSGVRRKTPGVRAGVGWGTLRPRRWRRQIECVCAGTGLQQGAAL